MQLHLVTQEKMLYTCFCIGTNVSSKGGKTELGKRPADRTELIAAIPTLLCRLVVSFLIFLFN